MATAIREIELSQPIADITDLGAYARCMLVFRWRGVVAGRAFVPAQQATLTTDAILAHAAHALGWDSARVWLEDFLQFDEREPCAAPLTATVAVCTRERPEDLARTLRALTALAPAPHEIIVIDNDPSTARTRDTVSQYPGVRYVVEPRRGLDRARNRALIEARGDVVAFTDDDAMPEREWLGALLANFGDRRLLCATGLTLPRELETPAQELFEEHCSFVRGFSRRVFDGRVDHPLAVSRVGAGANMAVRREVLDLVGRFDETLDAGTPTQSGGDHDYFSRILAAGYRIAYDPRAVSWHTHRRTQSELLSVVRGYGAGVYAMWTGRLVQSRDLGVLRLAWRWFVWDHWPLLRSPRRLTAMSARDRLRLAELRGCLWGPFAWLTSRRAARSVMS